MTCHMKSTFTEKHWVETWQAQKKHRVSGSILNYPGPRFPIRISSRPTGRPSKTESTTYSHSTNSKVWMCLHKKSTPVKISYTLVFLLPIFNMESKIDLPLLFSMFWATSTAFRTKSLINKCSRRGSRGLLLFR